MSYRVDIPTLSANEVYTLTFEYEGTETIQLIVGDLTLETTDRRVVFTTTSPVNYIESNVNLTNLNLYEGYYESDDFGGEYTQESYIEGKSLINLCEINFIGDTSSWKYQMTGYDEEGYMHIIPRPSGHATYYKVYPKTQPWRTKYGTYTLVIDFTSTFPDKTVDTCWESSSDAGYSAQKKEDFTYNGGQSRKFVVTFITSETKSYYMELNLGDLNLTTNTSGEILVSYMVVEGDYFDEFCKEEKTKSWLGIGCVKSPKIVSRNEDGTEESIITTPDDLELHCNHHYDRNTKTSTPCYQDTLDLTTGTVTRKNIKVRLNDCIAKSDRLEGALVTVNGGDMVRVRYDHTNSSTGIFPVQIDGEVIGTSATGIVFSASQGGYDGAWYPTSDIEHAYANTNTMFMYFNPSRFDGIDYTNSTTIKNWLIEQDFTLIIKIQNASVYTEQLPTSLNALKSYHNGSITTSSQQLTPTLKTTLPVSNKFTTTNLTSGSTYNVYFDGTATKLDAGGTIITDPVSPCEVECGGTTLTIEGTDIQNVRVLETSVKNEVGSVCGTTDVELSRIKTKCELYNYFDDIVISQNIATTTEIDYEVSKMIVTPTSNTVAYNVSQVIALSGTYKFHCKVKMKSLTDKYKFMFGYTNMNTNDVTPTSLVEEINLVTYINTNTQAYFYALYANNPVEYYDISLIKLSDEDITGTDTSSINYSQTISNLEQPIKLRSLGTTYDTYNPVTGELTKRIGVSETDGSYSVLSSPIVGKLEKSCSFMGNLATSDQLLVYNGATKNGDVITLNKVNRWSLVQLAGSCTRMEKGKKYICILHDIVGDMTDVVFVRQQDTSNDILPIENNRVIFTAMSNASNRWCFIQQNEGIPNGGTVSFKVSIIEYFEGAEKLDIPYFNTYEQRDLTLQLLPPTCPHLYTNGQVKVYSESEVYPTTILNGQSTNNYEVNELNKSNNYTIRYEGTCESINLNGKSNEQGTNRIVKTSTNGSGNLTFVNDNGDINNVLLVQNDVREQEINHFNGLQTVEINQLFVSSKQNLFEAYMKNDFDYENVTPWNTSYSSLHRGVFNCGVSVAGNNSQLTFDVIHPKIGGGISEETPIMKAGKIYNISCGITVNDDTSNRKYDIAFYNKSGSQIYAQKIDNISPVLSINTTANNTNTTAKINANTFFNEDVHDIRLHAIYGGTWKFDCTITDFTICEPENAKPDVPLVYEYIDLPQPVQLNSLPDGTCDTYNPITGEYVQNVGTIQLDSSIVNWNKTWSLTSSIGYSKLSHVEDWGEPSYKTLVNEYSMPNALTAQNSISNNATMSREFNGGWSYWGAVDFGVGKLAIIIPREFPGGINEALQYLDENPIIINYKRTTPITTQLTPINIPTFEGGILQLITTDGKVFPMIEYSMATNNRYDTSSWETGAVYTQRNMTEIYFNESTTPMIPTETMTLTTDHISSGSIILNDNGNGLIVLKGNYTGRDIPYFTGMRSVEAIEVEVTPSPDQPLFGKGGRK